MTASPKGQRVPRCAPREASYGSLADVAASTAHTEDEAINALVPAANTGDPRALQQLINLIHPAVVRYCRVRVSSQRYPTAEDIAQEICLAVARALPDFVDKGLPFMAFGNRIAANKVVDARRAYSRDRAQPTDDVPVHEQNLETPEARILGMNSRNDVSLLLDILSDKAREIITLRAFGGYSAEETAKILGMSSGAVRVDQFRALAKLRKHIEEFNPKQSESFSTIRDFKTAR